MPAKQEKEKTFEVALEELEALIDAMEEGDVPLEKLVDSYAQGVQLLKVCQNRLKGAELKIDTLTKENAQEQ